jgi:hypothetical protein
MKDCPRNGGLRRRIRFPVTWVTLVTFICLRPQYRIRLIQGPLTDSLSTILLLAH